MTLRAFIREAIASSATRMYHGSPYGGVEDYFNVVRPPIFFTRDHGVAKKYAGKKVLMAGSKPHSGVRDNPTVYTVDIDASRSFDMRQGAHQKLYEELRAAAVASNPNDPDIRHDYPRLRSEGFIMSNTGLPGFGYARALVDLLKGKFDSIWIDEGSQGVSLAVIEPRVIHLVSMEPLVETIKSRKMPVARQQTSWTCGPASLKAVVKLLKGIDLPEDKLADISNATQARGTSPDDIMDACGELGLDAERSDELTNGALRRCMEDGTPVILDVDMWDGEHWVVVHACDGGSFTMMDPAVGESLTVDDKALDGMRWDFDNKRVRGGIIISA